MALRAVSITILAVIVPGFASAQEFHLSCAGEASHLSSSSSFGSGNDNQGNSYSSSATTYYRAVAPDRLIIEIEPGKQRIRVPSTIIPPIHGGGQDGWWSLKNVKVTDDAISGQFELNFINKPTFQVDRRTGDISLRGFGNGFRGACEKFDPAPEARKF